MRTPFAFASAAVVIASISFASTARADAMDPAIERLTKPYQPKTGALPDGAGSSCTLKGAFIGNISPTEVVQCDPDDIAFAKLINQYAAAIAPTAMHSARTTGFGGFHLSLEGAITSIDKNQSYWEEGTRGPQDPNNKQFSVRNNDPASALQVYSIKIRKGFPFGFEISGQVGMLSQTTIVTGGADVRLSLLEGFRKGALGVLPDLAAGGGVRTISGTPQFNLTVASFDAQISKNLPVGESNILTPYVGFQYLWIFGDSGLVDTTPKTDPVGYCNYSGPNVPGNPDPDKKGADGKQFFDGQPNCVGKTGGGNHSPLDFNNTKVFNNVRLTRQRLVAGINYRYEMVFLGLHFITDIASPENAGGRDNSEKLKGEKGQNTYVFEVGAFF